MGLRLRDPACLSPLALEKSSRNLFPILLPSSLLVQQYNGRVYAAIDIAVLNVRSFVSFVRSTTDTFGAITLIGLSPPLPESEGRRRWPCSFMYETNSSHVPSFHFRFLSLLRSRSVMNKRGGAGDRFGDYALDDWMPSWIHLRRWMKLTNANSPDLKFWSLGLVMNLGSL